MLSPLHITRAATAILAALTLALGGCSGASRPPSPPADTIIAPEAARNVPIASADGRAASWDKLLAAACAADIVIIGENHGHPLGLAAASALWQDILARSPRAALALEFFERDEQSRLDDYLSGITDEATFRKRTERSEGNYPPGHRAMVQAAKAAHRPVIAANAPRQYVRAARLRGYTDLSDLTPEQRRLFRVPDDLLPPSSRYREDFNAVMTGPSAPAPPPGTSVELDAARAVRLEAAFRAQQMWDWTLAESIARAATAGHTPVVLVVGRFHADFDGGLVQALWKLRPGSRILTVSMVNDPAPIPRDNQTGALRDSDKGRANFCVYVNR